MAEKWLRGSATGTTAKTMTTQTAKLPRQFYRMPLRPCPYLPGRTEQNIFTELAGPGGMALYNMLTQAGFRRSHTIAYRPACPGCRACVPVRIAVDHFTPGRSLRRVLRRNRDLETREAPAAVDIEHYRLFSRYVGSRHEDGEMADMSFGDYAAMVEESPLPSQIVAHHRDDGSLAAACLVDRLRDGLSAVYSFFDPLEPDRSLGTYVVLHLVERTRELGLPYLYLGYWIADSRKMAYKARFQPLEALGPGGWQPLEIPTAP